MVIKASDITKRDKRIAELEAQLEAVRKVSENGNLSWQDRHIAIWKIVHPQAIKGDES